MSTSLNHYDELTIALHALRGLNSLVSGGGNMIDPGEFGPLLSLVVDQFDAVHAEMQKEQA